MRRRERFVAASSHFLRPIRAYTIGRQMVSAMVRNAGKESPLARTKRSGRISTSLVQVCHAVDKVSAFKVSQHRCLDIHGADRTPMTPDACYTLALAGAKAGVLASILACGQHLIRHPQLAAVVRQGANGGPWGECLLEGNYSIVSVVDDLLASLTQLPIDEI